VRTLRAPFIITTRPTSVTCGQRFSSRSGSLGPCRHFPQNRAGGVDFVKTQLETMRNSQASEVSRDLVLRWMMQLLTRRTRAQAPDGNVVDRLSLYLSVRDHGDERVAQAAEQRLESLPW